jgi:hypothetical protein
MRYTFLLGSALLWVGFAYGQDSVSTKPVDDTALRPTCVPEAKAADSKTSGDGKAKIVVYREQKFKGKIIKPPLICDGVDVAFMPPGGYLTLLASPGKHTVESDSKKSPVTVDLKEGEVTYLKFHIVMGAWHGLGAIEQATSDEGKESVAKLTPVTDPQWFDVETKAK